MDEDTIYSSTRNLWNEDEGEGVGGQGYLHVYVGHWSAWHETSKFVWSEGPPESKASLVGLDVCSHGQAMQISLTPPSRGGGGWSTVAVLMS